MQITDSSKELKIPPLFRLGFRPFFLAAALFSFLPIIVFVLFQHGILFSGLTDFYWWHAHELVFGFAGAIIVGFLLTAVQNWTGSPGIRGWRLFSIFIIWLLARISLYILGERSVIPFIFDLIWLPAAGVFLAIPIIQKKQWKNLFFIPMLVLFTLLNAGSYLALAFSYPQIAIKLIFAGIFTIITLIMIMGGRVIPFFTARGTNQTKTEALKWLEVASLLPMWLIVISWALLPASWLQHSIMGAILVYSGVINLIRAMRWKPLSTLKVPLLWSLHLSYFFIPVGLIAIGFSTIFSLHHFNTALHLITIGGIGGVILAMIARVSLGHTGRMLTPSFSMSIAFSSILLSTLIRVIVPYFWPEYMIKAYDISASLWVVAFGLFIINYAPILLKARVDGRPG